MRWSESGPAGARGRVNTHAGRGRRVRGTTQFTSRHGMVVHSRHSVSIGTPSTDLRNSLSLSFKGCADMSACILRHNNAETLGVRHTIEIYNTREVHSMLFALLIIM
jgi:hypothetical protein